jgi:hypothetical protein
MRDRNRLACGEPTLMIDSTESRIALELPRKNSPEQKRAWDGKDDFGSYVPKSGIRRARVSPELFRRRGRGRAPDSAGEVPSGTALAHCPYLCTVSDRWLYVDSSANNRALRHRLSYAAKG